MPEPSGRSLRNAARAAKARTDNDVASGGTVGPGLVKGSPGAEGSLGLGEAALSIP